MNKTKKNYFKMLPVFLALIVMLTMGTSLYAKEAKTTSSPISPDVSEVPSGSIGSVDSAVGNIWGTVVLILQVAAIGAIIFAGVRYMFASADAKADIKKQTVTLAIGAVLVFGATTLVQFLTTAVDQVTTPNTPVVPKP
ncbi:MAG: TrbC/VirB2 family protein [Clostridia bacterium]